MGQFLSLPVILVIALGLAAALQTWVFEPRQIPSGRWNRPSTASTSWSTRSSMTSRTPASATSLTSTLRSAPRQASAAPCPLANKEEDKDKEFIKRIVAGPGDTLSIKDGHPVVNGVEKKDEPYINPCEDDGPGICNLPRTITIAPDHYFVMGDNRAASDDSRFWGPISRDWIIGKAFATYWPPDRWGFF